MRGDFSNVDLSKLIKTKRKREGHFFSKDVWYDFNMTCEVSVSDEVGVLDFLIKVEGEPCGTTKLAYQHE